MKVGTPYYLSPEMFLGKGYNQATDLWSLGVTLFYSLSGQFPFDAEDETQLKALVVSKESSPNYEVLPLKYQQICKGLLTKVPKLRLKLNQILMLLN